jgi:DNA recombination protein RmuC
VDAKVPMNAYLDAVAAQDTETRQDRFAAHAQAVRSRVRQLSRKSYWAQFDHSPEFVVMFVPNESCLSAAFEHDGKTLYQRIAKLAEHIESLGTNLVRAVESYNDMVGSLEYRLLPSARRFEALGVETTEIPALDQVDGSTHPLTAEEMQHHD